MDHVLHILDFLVKEQNDEKVAADIHEGCLIFLHYLDNCKKSFAKLLWNWWLVRQVDPGHQGMIELPLWEQLRKQFFYIYLINAEMFKTVSRRNSNEMSTQRKIGILDFDVTRGLC